MSQKSHLRKMSNHVVNDHAELNQNQEHFEIRFYNPYKLIHTCGQVFLLSVLFSISASGDLDEDMVVS